MINLKGNKEETNSLFFDNCEGSDNDNFYKHNILQIFSLENNSRKIPKNPNLEVKKIFCFSYSFNSSLMNIQTMNKKSNQFEFRFPFMQENNKTKRISKALSVYKCDKSNYNYKSKR